jgi:hypothetical protein
MKSELSYELYGSSAAAGKKGIGVGLYSRAVRKNHYWLDVFMALCRMQRKMQKQPYFV